MNHLPYATIRNYSSLGITPVILLLIKVIAEGGNLLAKTWKKQKQLWKQNCNILEFNVILSKRRCYWINTHIIRIIDAGKCVNFKMKIKVIITIS